MPKISFFITGTCIQLSPAILKEPSTQVNYVLLVQSCIFEPPFYPAIAPSISWTSYQRNQSYMIMITVPNEYKCMYPLFKCIVAVCMGIFTL